MSYTPTIPPADPAAIPHYLTTELQALAQSLQQSQPYAYLQTLNVAPAKPREGLIAKADGTHWNPGSGAGVYCYIAGAWVFFGGGGGTGTVTHTSGALTAHAVIVGNGTADVKALAALGASGTVLTSNGAGADPSFQPGGGTGTVTSVGVGSTGSTLTVTGSPVTGSGTINADFNLGHRNEWTATQNVAQVALTDASSITPNGALSNQFYLLTTSAVGGSRTINLPSSLNPGDFVNFEIKQPASGGPCVVVWAAGYTWGQGSQGSAPVISTVAGASDFFSFTVRADGNLHGGMIGQGGSTGPGYAASSSTSLTPGTGAKALTTQLGLAYSAGCRARATSASTGDYFEGPVASYTSAGVLTITADTFSGSTARTDWNINVAGNVGATGGQGIAGPAGSGNGVNLQTGTTYTYVSGDASKLVSHSNASAIAATLPQATGSFASPFVFDVENRGAGTLTITPTTSTIDGAASLALTTNQGCHIFSDGTNWYTQRGIGGGSSGASSISWSPTDKSANIQLSNRFVATNSTGGAAAYQLGRATLGVNAATSTLYFEISTAPSNGSVYNLVIGVAASTTPTSDFVGQDTASYGYQGSAGNTIFNSAAVSTYGVFKGGASIGVLIKAGALYFRLNGAWQGGSNPTTNTAPAFTGLTGTIYPAVSLYNATDSVTGCFKASSQVYNDWPAWDPS